MTASLLLPFAAFAAFLVIFRVRARRAGKTLSQDLADRNHATFSRRGPRVFRAAVIAFVAVCWIAILVAKLAGV